MKLLRQELARSAVGAMSQPRSFIDTEPKLCITLGDGTSAALLALFNTAN